ncbi:NUDIX hydrolase [Loktanella sp. S4079]|uniref:NUDIX hydrolase n=1 Tax=Loktanella sp. S4079 TaxID=579483 RepID=UPI0005FA4E41|nr:NUDIX domain-containing protein [Loktanella sp. S4079]KJZ18684.1 hypothetical protein TW80_14490 [Loktanella sp. S4079]
MTKTVTHPDKALIYATNARGLLVFCEPDFPDVPFQVPGGTIEPGETPINAAIREFREETGLHGYNIPVPLGVDKHVYTHMAQQHVVTRYFFHMQMPDDLPVTWDHIEQTPHNGHEPILFRFSWQLLSQAQNTLGLGMNAALPRLPKRHRPN